MHSWGNKNVCGVCGLVRSNVRGRQFNWTVYKVNGAWTRVRPECVELSPVEHMVRAYIQRELRHG